MRRRLEEIGRTAAALADERALLVRYRGFFDAFASLAGAEARFSGGRAFYLVLRRDARQAVAEIERALGAALGGQFELVARPLPSGETAAIVFARGQAAARVAELLAAARIEELPAPEGLGEPDLLRAMPGIRARLEAIPGALASLETERRALARRHRAELERFEAQLRDRVALLEAHAKVREGEFLFLVEGWLPGSEAAALAERLARELGPEVLVERIATEPWMRADAPVALANPALFRPFELVTRTLPIPRYGSIDPTPYVAVFLPMFFGLMLGDAGYGALLAAIALALRWRSPPASRWRAIAAVAGACAAFTIVFGLLFGEVFGDLGRRLGLPMFAFEREEALLPFLAFAVALGTVHVLLGLVLAALSAWRRGERRAAMGRGVTVLMIALSGFALLAAFEVLPASLFTPAVVIVLVAFPLLVALEGLVAVVELLSAYGHILSYARIMAIGTASVMLAVVANRLAGAMGSLLVGVLFALLFHLVNFVLGLFTPGIHALRLHYVEFFGKFYSPGGTAYEPFAHWPAHRRGAGP